MLHLTPANSEAPASQASFQVEPGNEKNDTLEFQPDDYKIWYNQGETLTKLGRYEEALACFDQALAIQLDDPATWVFRGVVLIYLGRYSSALASCEKALAINPHETQAWIFRGAALNYLGCYKQAYASYDKALGIERRSVWQKLTQKLKRILASVLVF